MHLHPFRLATALLLASCAEDAATPSTPDPAVTTAVGTTESAPRAAAAGVEDGPTYRLGFDDRARHLIDVTLTLPAAPAGTRTLWMPTWTPGSYLLREYARHVEGLTVVDAAGTPVPTVRSSKNRWTLEAGATPLTAQYRVYAREASVRTNFVDADLAVINGAALFITEEGREGAPHRVIVDLPRDWSGAHTGLDRTTGGGATDFTATDLDELLDSPLVLGDATVRALEVDGVPHSLVLAGDLGPWDVDGSTADVSAIVREQIAFWGNVPYAHYTFLNVVNEARGGLEHLDSTLMMTNRRATTKREDYVRWMGLVSHEFFHTWNVKRLRPAPLGPFDYEHEVYTPSLWVAEGLTSYYDDLLLVRAGLITEKEYLGRLSDQLTNLQKTPGRQVQSLAEASADAWIKYYRKDENTVNTGISYYTKGMIVGWLLDSRIRCETDGARSLDDVMRLAYTRFSGDRGYTPAEFEAVIAEVAGTPLTGELDSWLRSTDELDPGPALACLGLRLQDPDADENAADEDAAGEDAGKDADAPETEPEPEDPPAGWLGAGLEARQGRHVVVEVKRGTPAWDAGLNVDDGLVAIDGTGTDERADPLWASLAPEAPSDSPSPDVMLRDLSATLTDKPREKWTVEIDPDAQEEAVQRRSAWLASTAGSAPR